MSSKRNVGHPFQVSLVLLLTLVFAIGVRAQQNNKKSSPPPSRPAPAVHSSAPTHSQTPHPGSNTHSSNAPGRNGTMNSANGRPGPNGSRNGAGTSMNHNARGPIGGGNSNMARANGRPTTAMNHPLPGKQVSLRGGGSASIRPNGQIRSINRNGMQINHGLNGSRRIESTHNGARIVSTGKHSGYVQRAYVTRGGRTYVSRTVVVNHVTYTSVYRSYSYGGYCCYYGYRPAYYYAPAYYGWAYNPWPAPVYYGWGWGGAPWYGYYGGYFAPYPAYPSAAFWLTDYLIAANLQAAYQAQAAATAGGGDNGGGEQQQPQQQPTNNNNDNSGNNNSGNNSTAVTLTPEVKDAIAEEVKAQLAAQQSAAQQSSAGSQQQAPAANAEEVPPALDPARRTFIVASDLAVSSNGQECQLTEGDVIKRTSDQPDDNRQVTATVSASKKSDCAVGAQIAVGVDDLQEMHNHFEEQLDNGMKDLSSKQGQSGLPKAPDTSTKPSDVPPPPPDNSAAKALEDQQSAADQTEAQVTKEAFSQGS